ncbi:MAG: 30S ribosomal protein S4e [Candidatus Diapherotrites archaeon]|nr:30S ribosomal protein S4e [Candidatus Diapherotrites archaeon]
MAGKGNRTHQKSISAPRSWHIKRKQDFWVKKVTPGPHPKEMAIPISVLMRDILNIANSQKEVKHILSKGNVIVNGKPIKETGFPVGLMDIVEIPELKQVYRIVLDIKGRISPQPIKTSEKKSKLCKITEKTTLKGKKTQLNFHDGRNMVVEDESFKVNDVVLLEVPKQKIVGHYAFKEGNTGYVVKGKHAGKVATVKLIVPGTQARASLVEMEHEGEMFQTRKANVFIIGDQKSKINIREEMG